MEPIVRSLYDLGVVTYTVDLERHFVDLRPVHLEKLDNVLPMAAGAKVLPDGAVLVAPTMLPCSIEKSVFGFADVARVATRTGELINDP